MTMSVAVGATALPAAFPLIATLGVEVVAKKPDGNISVITLPAISGPPYVVNENMAAAILLPAARSPLYIWNVVQQLDVPEHIWPDVMSVGLALASAVVWTEIEVAPAVAAPIVSPLSVTVTAVLTAMDDEPARVSTMAVAVGATLVAVTEVPLIAAVGVADVAKKPPG